MAERRFGGDAPEAGEVYLEFTIVGAQQRAVAIDPQTGIEVTVFGPANVSRDEIGRLAVRKLERRLASGGEGARPRSGVRLA